MSASFIRLEDYAAITGQTVEQAREQLQAPELRRFLIERSGNAVVNAEVLTVQTHRGNGSSSPAPDKPAHEQAAAGENPPAEPAPEAPAAGNEAAALREQLQEQRKEIEALRLQLQEKDRVILDYAGKFAEMAAQAQSIAAAALTTTGQAQYLQAAAQADKAPGGAVEAAEIVPAEDAAAVPEEPAEDSSTGAGQKPHKRSFWDWLRGR